MTTHYVEDHPDRKAEDTVPATPVEGLDREPKAIEAKVVEAPAKAPAKKSAAKVTTKKG
jgi:hypothetical protein